MKHILLATDFSERSDRALRRATLLARQFGAGLTLVHVVDDDQPQRIVQSERHAAESLLEELGGTVRQIDGIACRTRVLLADPFAGIVHAAAQEAPDLLVVGPHRRQALRDVFVGTTAERTIRSVACPVLMVNAPPVGAYGRVLLATDLSEGARHAAEACTALQIARGAQLTILHVFGAPAGHLAMGHTMPPDGRQSYLDDRMREAARRLSDFVSTLDRRSLRQTPDPTGNGTEDETPDATGRGFKDATGDEAGGQTLPRRVRQTVRQAASSPAETILAEARQEAADLVVVGTHGRRGLARFFLGSAAEAVLRNARSDVLAVPPAA